MCHPKIPIISCGDPAGVGTEVLLKSWRRLRNTGQSFAVIHNADLLNKLSEFLKIDVPLRVIESPEQAASCFADALPVLNIRAGFSQVSFSSEAVISLMQALAHKKLAPNTFAERLGTLAGYVDFIKSSLDEGIKQGLDNSNPLVTLPINKYVMSLGGFKYQGHTEYIKDYCGVKFVVMMLATRKSKLKVCPVKVHQSLANSIKSLSVSDIVNTVRLVHQYLLSNGSPNPYIAVLGLNPHAGENGLMGDEEKQIITPAIQMLIGQGIRATQALPEIGRAHV